MPENRSKPAASQLVAPDILRAALPRLAPDVGVQSEELQHYCAFFGLDVGDYEGDAGVRHDLGYFPSGEYAVACHVFRQSGADTTAVILHGLFDHAGLFTHLLNYCLSRGWSVVVFDLPGHGLSSGQQADIHDFEDYTATLRDCLAQLSPFDLPEQRIGFGQSTGGAVLMTHLLRTDDFADAVLLAPLVRPVGWRWTFPTLSLVKLFTERLPRKFAQSSNDANFLVFLRTRDPLQPRYLSINWVGAMKRWSLAFESLPPKPEQQVLVLQGKQDWTVDWRYNLKVIRRLFPNGTQRTFSMARHHLVNEVDSIRSELWAAIDDYHGVMRE